MNDHTLTMSFWQVLFAEVIAGLACYGAVVCAASLEIPDEL